MRSRFKSWAKPYLDAHPDFVLKNVDSDSAFFEYEHLSLEIGSGKGAFLLQMAAKFPSVHFLALERDVSICGVLAKKIEESKLTNIRLIVSDFDDCFESLKGLGFDEVFLNFSDPWPKKKHAKRRLTTEGRLSKMEQLLKTAGLLKIKTDNDILFDFTVEEGTKTDLRLLLALYDYRNIDENDAMTEYESAFREEGKPIHRIIYQKKEK